MGPAMLQIELRGAASASEDEAELQVWQTGTEADMLEAIDAHGHCHDGHVCLEWQAADDRLEQDFLFRGLKTSHVSRRLKTSHIGGRI